MLVHSEHNPTKMCWFVFHLFIIASDRKASLGPKIPTIQAPSKSFVVTPLCTARILLFSCWDILFSFTLYMLMTY